MKIHETVSEQSVYAVTLDRLTGTKRASARGLEDQRGPHQESKTTDALRPSDLLLFIDFRPPQQSGQAHALTAVSVADIVSLACRIACFCLPWAFSFSLLPVFSLFGICSFVNPGVDDLAHKLAWSTGPTTAALQLNAGANHCASTPKHRAGDYGSYSIARLAMSSFSSMLIHLARNQYPYC
ncbi:hypothetical protein An16g07590 [Aspergillus niger]|uniref:Uncharacterized protein n=2 Tax=Aspergillus niger TaxID=5061 RepID=A2R8L6_ASPNC|nr:hypothetical protein An16g07590 [Aspergillus niger]CAL00531.1 hypothetical protein An16g07590 [Aspergillus niger]